MTVVTCDCGSRMSHKAVCGSKKAKYESQIGLSLMHESQIHPGFACKAVCKQIIASLRSLIFCMFQGDLFAEPLTLSDPIGYLAHTSPPMVSTPGRKAAPLCAAFAFYATRQCKNFAFSAIQVLIGKKRSGQGINPESSEDGPCWSLFKSKHQWAEFMQC
jgi:hypothetical protein